MPLLYAACSVPLFAVVAMAGRARQPARRPPPPAGALPSQQLCAPDPPRFQYSFFLSFFISFIFFHLTPPRFHFHEVGDFTLLEEASGLKVNQQLQAAGPSVGGVGGPSLPSREGV